VRSARRRTWAADSSAVTYRVRRPARAHDAATSSSSVDLPTPGSPASRATAPGTRPSPSARSSSPMPVGTARASSAGTSVMRSAAARGGVTFAADADAPPSAIEPQARHSLHRPTHTGVDHPHSPQR